MDRSKGTFARQVRIIREKIEAGDLVFCECLHQEMLERAIEECGIEFRDRIYTPWVSLWLFLNQVLQRSSCQRVVSQLIAYRESRGLPLCSPKTTAYCEGRSRLPEELYKTVLCQCGQQAADSAPAEWNYRGRAVKVMDGTTVSLPETNENCKQYPLQDPRRAGLSFPMVRMLVLFSLSVGTVLEVVLAPYRGKATSEYALLRQLRHALQKNDLVLADCGFCSFAHLAELRGQGVDSLVKLDASRRSNLKFVKRLGKRDALYRWKKPRSRPETFSPEEFQALPEEMLVRIIRVCVAQKGFRCKVFEIVTTLTDHETYLAEELADLYRRRWAAELSFRDIKSTLKMDYLSCKSPEMAHKELYAHLIAYNLIRIQIAQAAELADIRPEQISFKAALETILEFQAYRAFPTSTLAVMHATIAFHRVGKQPHRNEPRVLKRRQKHSLLTQPRSAYGNSAA